MEINTTINPVELNSFLLEKKLPEFLQSFGWGEFQKSLPKKIWRIGLTDGNQLIAAAQLIENSLPFSKTYLYIPRGPVFADNLKEKDKAQALTTILKGVRDITVSTKNTQEVFIRFEPAFLVDEINLKPLKFKKTKPIQPPDTLLLDLKPDKEKILHSFHQKTRYNIRLAEKRRVKVKQGDLTNFEDFWQLMSQTAKRDKFNPHSKDYYQKLLEFFSSGSYGLQIKLWLATKDDKSIAAALVGYFGQTVSYLHGASDYNYRNLMAPHLLHWQIIKDAKANNFETYDFWGVAPENVKNTKPGWAGLTRFKRGFGGREINYVGAYDLIYDKRWYTLYNLAKKFL